MLIPVAPISNTERQRRFRQRHPGYYARIHGRERAAARAAMEKAKVARQFAAAPSQAPAPNQQLLLPAPQPSQRPQLLLAAPAVTVQIPGMTMIPTISSSHDVDRVKARRAA